MTGRALLLAVALPLAAGVSSLRAQTTQTWSTPVRTEQVDPQRMERAETVAKPGPFDARLPGTWEVWIPSGVRSRVEGNTRYREYVGGAAMERLEIARGGTFRWGERRGRLVEVRPWYAQENRRYYRVTDPRGNEYELYFNEQDGRLILLFGGVGGHAATGTRQGAAGAPGTPAPPAGASGTSPAPPTTGGAAYRAGEKVQVQWQGSWYAATVLQAGEGRYLVHYDGWASFWDEWVGQERIRRAPPASR